VRKIDLSNFQIATSETARDINRRIVLNLIRLHQPISRAEISRVCGLQRSTVSAIVEQLISERWVIEGVAEKSARGRRPTSLHLNTDRTGILGVDIGPVQTTIGLASLDARFFAQDVMPTGKNPVEFVHQLGKRLAAMIRLHPDIACEGVGISLPGRTDPGSHRLVFAPNLDWKNLDLKGPLEKATGLPVELENAANACALAELWFGQRSEKTRNLVAVTVSEGIGVGMIFNGQLIKGESGMAGEFGHVSFDRNGPSCHCGGRGCWETYASNNAAIRDYLTSSDGMAPNAATFDELLALVERDQPLALEVLDRMAVRLGRGLAMLASGLAPDTIVVVGKITLAWRKAGPVAERAFREALKTPANVRLVATDPASQPRLRGALVLVLQKHFGAPINA
jgi:predicted NBD/HSP70 family sugar kinase